MHEGEHLLCGCRACVVGVDVSLAGYYPALHAAHIWPGKLRDAYFANCQGRKSDVGRAHASSIECNDLCS